MRYMTTCCGSCCTVQTGSRVLSIITLAGRGLGLVCTVLMLIFFDYVMDEAGREREQEMSDLMHKTYSHGKAVLAVEGAIDEKAAHRLFSAITAGAVLAGIGTVVDSLFVYGAFMNRRLFILPHLVFDAIYTVSIIIIVIDLIAAQANKLTTTSIVLASVSAVVLLIVQLYFFFVVLSFYKSLVLAEHNPEPADAYTGDPQNDPQSYPTEQGQCYPTMPEKDGAV